MHFQLIPILDQMEAFYQQPISIVRFQQYLQLLQGKSKTDMVLPIAGYNPMAKEHVLQKVQELKTLQAEVLALEIIEALNVQWRQPKSRPIRLAINVADDVKGGWTQYYTTDFDSKFKLSGLVSRNFCAPYFWAGESYSRVVIKERILSYALRTLYWLQNPAPITLADHLQQEIFVWKEQQKILPTSSDAPPSKAVEFLELFFQEYSNSDNYSLIFNFFYGDMASELLNYPTFGIEEVTGFQYSKWKL